MSPLLRVLSPACHDRVTITGEPNMTIPQVLSVSRGTSTVELCPSSRAATRAAATLDVLQRQVAEGTAIYGVSSAYGGQAGRVLNQGDAAERLEQAKQLSRAIVHVDVSTGTPLPIDLVRAALLIRINTLSFGFSGIRPATLDTVVKLLNEKVTPVVGRYGSLGASGDLAQNGRLVSVLLQLPSARVYDATGAVRKARDVLPSLGLAPVDLAPKEGLALVNGDNYSTAAALLILSDLTRMTLLELAIAALAIQALKGSDRNFHPLLDAVRPHQGQRFVAQAMRSLLQGSQLSLQELTTGHQPKLEGINIQDPYSIRCLPQFLGPDVEGLARIRGTIETNMNAVSDNPLWTDEDTAMPGESAGQWVSGGNFLAMHMADSLDALRKTAARLVKLNDRYMSRLIHPALNQGLPANLSPNASVSRCLCKGLQTQMGMFEVYASTLAMPITTNFGVHEELNQDLTSHALSSYLIASEQMRVLARAQATTLIATCQAIDLRGGPSLLSPATRGLFDWVRSKVEFVETERPFADDIECVAEDLAAAPLPEPLMTEGLSHATGGADGGTKSHA